MTVETADRASQGPRGPGRGVRLNDLDRALVYRIGYVGRRWEVLGAEGAPDEGGAGPGLDGAGDGVASTAGPAPSTPSPVATRTEDLPPR